MDLKQTDLKQTDFLQPVLKPNNEKWFAIYTVPRGEKKVVENLRLKGLESYLPLHSSPRVWSDRIKIVDVPLFTSYVFVKCNESAIYSLNFLRGVVKVVFYDGKPAVIRQTEIDAIKEFLEVASGKTLCTGDEVEILSGTMKNISGRIIEIKKKYIMLRIKQLAATVCVEKDNIAPLKRIK
jgi:transcription antitermination factor NusG